MFYPIALIFSYLSLTDNINSCVSICIKKFWGPSLQKYTLLIRPTSLLNTIVRPVKAWLTLKSLRKASFKPYEWEFLFFPVISAFFRIAVSWSWKIEHLLCLSYLSQYYALHSTRLSKQQFVIFCSARILHGLMWSKTMKYKLRSKQLKIQSKLILIHGQYALKPNILMSRKPLDHGNLYKQTMTTCTSTKVLGVKVFY